MKFLFMMPKAGVEGRERTRMFLPDGTELRGVTSFASEPMEGDRHLLHIQCASIAKLAKSVTIAFALPEIAFVNEPPRAPLPPHINDRLRALIAKWRSHWSCADMGADKESASFGGGIEKCAEELEALLDEVKTC